MEVYGQYTTLTLASPNKKCLYKSVAVNGGCCMYAGSTFVQISASCDQQLYKFRVATKRSIEKRREALQVYKFS